MKRMTNKNYEKDRLYLNCDPDCTKISCEECSKLLSTVERLADIKDILGDEYDLDRLRELVQADRDGRCVVLPQKKVFKITSVAGQYCDLICPIKIDGISQCDCCEYGVESIEECDCRQEHLEEIGKNVFLTREQAEFVLNEMKEAESE